MARLNFGERPSTQLRLALGAVALLAAVVFSGMQLGLISTPQGGISFVGGSLPSGPGVLNEGVVGTLETPLPLFAASGADRAVVALTYRALTHLDRGGSAEPEIATSWSVAEDGLTWTFLFDPAAAWSDGTPITPNDALFTIGVAGQLGIEGGYFDALSAEIGADGASLIVRTPREVASLPVALGALPLLPAHIFEGLPIDEIASSEAARRSVSSGPFQVTSISSSAAAFVRRNDLLAGDLLRIAGAEGSVEAIALRFYPDGAAALDAWGRNEIDLLAGLSRDEVQLGVKHRGSSVELGSTVFTGIATNLRPGAVLRNSALRRGLLALLDPEWITTRFGGSVARTPVSPLSWAWTEIAPSKSGAAYATAQLKSAGWKEKEGLWVTKAGKTVRLEILTLPAVDHPADAAIAAQAAVAWTRFGIPTSVVEADANQLDARLASGDFTAVVLNVEIGIDPDLYPLFGSAAVLAGGNVSGIQVKQLDDLLNAARKPAALEVRREALAAVQRWLAAADYFLPIRFRGVELLTSEAVQGASPLIVETVETHLRDVLSFRIAAP